MWVVEEYTQAEYMDQHTQEDYTQEDYTQEEYTQEDYTQEEYTQEKSMDCSNNKHQVMSSTSLWHKAQTGIQPDKESKSNSQR